MLCYNPWHIYFKYLLGEIFHCKAGKEIDCVVLAPEWSSPGLAVHCTNGFRGESHLLLPAVAVCLHAVLQPCSLGSSGCSCPALLLSAGPSKWHLCRCSMCTGEKWLGYQWMHHKITENVLSKEESLSKPPSKIRLFETARVCKRLSGLPELIDK